MMSLLNLPNLAGCATAQTQHKRTTQLKPRPPTSLRSTTMSTDINSIRAFLTDVLDMKDPRYDQYELILLRILHRVADQDEWHDLPDYIIEKLPCELLETYDPEPLHDITPDYTEQPTPESSPGAEKPQPHPCCECRDDHDCGWYYPPENGANRNLVWRLSQSYYGRSNSGHVAEFNETKALNGDEFGNGISYLRYVHRPEDVVIEAPKGSREAGNYTYTEAEMEDDEPELGDVLASKDAVFEEI